jgi:hypothetical protein
MKSNYQKEVNKLAMIIRTGFNNQGWSSKCKNAKSDKRLFKCHEKSIDTGFKINKSSICIADCLESTLCRKLFWVNDKGNFNIKKAIGKVFFVFPVKDNSLVLWGVSEIKNVKGNKIFFETFKAMPTNNWVKNISSKDIFGSPWTRLTFRYLDDEQEILLDDLISGYFYDPIETEISEIEGKKSLRKHLHIERSAKLVNAFKKSLKSYNCKVCNFNFEDYYGDIGANFIEAHHIRDLGSLKKEESISIRDLIAVCSNCHRMLHRTNPPLYWQYLLAKD